MMTSTGKWWQIWNRRTRGKATDNKHVHWALHWAPVTCCGQIGRQADRVKNHRCIIDTSTSSSFASSSSIIILSMRALCRSSRETAPIRASEKKQAVTKEDTFTADEMIRRWCRRRRKGTNISQICLWQTSSTDSLISSQPLTTFPPFSSFSHKFVQNFSPTKLCTVCSMAEISIALCDFVPIREALTPLQNDDFAPLTALSTWLIWAWKHKWPDKGDRMLLQSLEQ